MTGTTATPSAERLSGSEMSYLLVDELPKLRGYIVKWLAGFKVPPRDVEDVAQDVLVALVRHAPGINFSHALPYTKTVARNAAIRYFKEQGYADPVVDIEEAVADAPTPERCAFDKEMLGTLRAVLNDLTPDERNLLAKRYGEGRSTSEIADLLSIPEPTVKKRLRRAVERCFDGFKARGVKDRPGFLLVPLMLFLTSREAYATGGHRDNATAPANEKTKESERSQRVSKTHAAAFLAGGALVYLLLLVRPQQTPEFASCLTWVSAFPITVQDRCVGDAPFGQEPAIAFSTSPARSKTVVPSKGITKPPSTEKSTGGYGVVKASDPITDFSGTEGVDKSDVKPFVGVQQYRDDTVPAVEFGTER